MPRRPTSTSSFGVSKRENHDATACYQRFAAPTVSADQQVAADRAIDKLIVGDARTMTEVPDASVALVVTSPPYFAGKEYEEALGEGGVPATYLEYLQLLRDVFAQCVQKLEPGGRIAVNVANLGRRPYRSLSADVIGILQDDLRLLMRGEIVWMKQRGSSGSCAWGSFQQPANPVLRDLTERVVVASKGRFDRAVPTRARAGRGLPSQAGITRQDFMENTLDVWEIPAESATRIGHPAPFPVELPARLIDLYTYVGDLVVDPFAGSGTTGVAAVRSGRHFVGYDTDETYVRLAEDRLSVERARVATASPVATDDGALGRARREGWAAKEMARAVLEAAGLRDIRKDVRRPGGVQVDFTGLDDRDRLWLFDAAGPNSVHRGGLKRSDVLWKEIAKAAVLDQSGQAPFVLLTTDRPGAGSTGLAPLDAVVGAGRPVRSVIEMLQPGAVEDLRSLLRD